MGKRPRGATTWEPGTKRTKAMLADIQDRYEQHDADGTLPRGPRGIFYDLRPTGYGRGLIYFKPDSQHPKGHHGKAGVMPDPVRDTLAKARRAGIIPEQWVADGRAVDSMGQHYDTSAEDEADVLVDIVRNASLNLDPQRFQPVYIEVLCEAADLIPRLARIANPYGVRVYAGSGYDGLKGKREMGERATQRDKPTAVLQIGDRDDDGEGIYRAAGEDSVAWAEGDLERDVLDVDLLQCADRNDPDDDGWTGSLRTLRDSADDLPDLTFIRLGLTTDQGTDLGLLDADGKAEVDAVPVLVMDRWLAAAIMALQNPACWELHVADEQEQRERLPGLIRRRLRGVR
jgi:hypothetical protein